MTGDVDLLGGLDTDLPATLAIGNGTALLLNGWCFHPRSRIVRLDVLVDSTPHPVLVHGLARPDVFEAHHPARDPHGHSFGSGFSVVVPVPRGQSGTSMAIALRARLASGDTCSRALQAVGLAAGIPAASTGAPPRVAICMATYNPPPALFERQIQSIREQTHEDWLCLISDDGSDPAAYAEIQRIVGDDPRFCVSSATERAGFYRNFERCLGLVPPGTEFVALADHDDRWYPEKLETLLSAFEPATTLVYSDMRIIRANGDVVSNTYWTTRANRYDEIASLLIANTITGAASMFRAALLEDVLPFPQKVGEPFHDQWIAGVALALGPVKFVDRPLHDYVQHASNVLGHYAPAGRSGWAKLSSYARGLSLSRLRATLGGWRAVYYADVQKVKLNARVLEIRCGERSTPAKRRGIRRLARLDEAASSTVWLFLREIRAMGRVTETLRGEATLLRGLFWRMYSRVRGALGPRGIRRLS